MKRILKRISMISFTLVFAICSAVMLSSCKKDKDEAEAQVMVLSVNPEIEFIVDEDDKVVSVSANNEDGAYILEKFTEFSGMSAKDAALKFLELSEEYGFVVSGSTDGETFTISISGEGDEKLYNAVKKTISKKAEEFGVSISELVEIDGDKLEEMVAECYQEYSEAEIDKLSDEEIIELIKKSRDETKGLVSIDDKQAYYRERAQEVISAKFDALTEYLNENQNSLSDLIQPYVSLMNTYYQTIQTKYSEINSQIELLYTTETTGIDAKLDNYIAKKKEYLNKVEEYKTAVENGSSDVQSLKQEMETLKEEAESLQTSLEALRTQAEEQLQQLIDEKVKESLEKLNENIDKIVNAINLNVSTIEDHVKSEVEALKTSYSQSATNPWNE